MIFSYITQDYHRNESIKSKFVLTFFRFCQYLSLKNSIFYKVLYNIFFGIYRILVDWIMGIDLHPRTKIGRGLALYHGVGIVVSKNSIIGTNCTLRQGVTIGRVINKDLSKSRDPIISDHVEFGALSMVLGDVKIGNYCKIGAGTVVTKNLDDYTTAVSQPFRVINK